MPSWSKGGKRGDGGGRGSSAGPVLPKGTKGLGTTGGRRGCPDESRGANERDEGDGKRVMRLGRTGSFRPRFGWRPFGGSLRASEET